MPGILFSGIDRRRFLIRTTQTLAGMAVGLRFSSVFGGDLDNGLSLALLSDTHVAADPKTENRKFLPWDNLKLTVEQVLETRPELTLLNGDAARLTGEVADYEAVQQLLAPLTERCPVCIGMGNHDNRENFHKVIKENSIGVAQKVADKHVLVIQKNGLRIILLDSLLFSNKTPGLLGKIQRDWLEKFLASSDSQATVIFVHHTLGDADGELLDAEAFLRIVRPFRKVKAIFYGHSHEYSYRQDRSIHLVNLPAVGYNFADKEPVGWVQARFTTTGADLTLRAFGRNRSKDKETVNLTWRT